MFQQIRESLVLREKLGAQVRFGRVKIRRPETLKAFDYSPSVTLYAVEVEEICPPTGQEPIHWRLLTTHDVLSLEQALQVIEWDKWRWRIEQLFATLKKAGLNLEATQLESPKRDSQAHDSRPICCRTNSSNG